MDDQDRDVSDQKRKEPCKDDLIDIPSDDDSMFDYSVFDIPRPFTDDYQISPVAASCGSSSYRQHAVATSSSFQKENLDAKDGKKTECPTCHGHFLADEIVLHADLCAENAHIVSFLGLKWQLHPQMTFQMKLLVWRTPARLQAMFCLCLIS